MYIFPEVEKRDNKKTARPLPSASKAGSWVYVLCTDGSGACGF